MVKFVKRMVRNEEGASLVEYGLLVALIALACIVGVTAVGTSLQTLFSNIAAELL